MEKRKKYVKTVFPFVLFFDFIPLLRAMFAKIQWLKFNSFAILHADTISIIELYLGDVLSNCDLIISVICIDGVRSEQYHLVVRLFILEHLDLVIVFLISQR